MNVLLIDDHKLFSQSMSMLCTGQGSVECVDCACTEEELEEKLGKEGGKRYDLILLDINLEKTYQKDGFSVAIELLEQYPELKIIMLTGFDLPVYQYQAKQIGVKGFVSKNIEPEKLMEVMQKIMDGGESFPTSSIFVDVLTAREKDILSKIGSGEKRKQVAKELYISERTLTNHIQNILDKLEAESVIQAVAKAYKLGYLK